MERRNIATVNKELNYLEVAYNRLMIKTIDYREEKEKLLAEKERLINMSDEELSKLERTATKQKESKLTRKLVNPNGGKDLPQPLFVDESKIDYIGR